MTALEPEVLPPESGPRARLAGVRALGLFGTALALLTMLAAFGFTLMILFGTTLFSAAAVYLLWPLIFSPQFTQFVFGAERAPFWKLFLLFLAAGTVVKLFRRQLWQRR